MSESDSSSSSSSSPIPEEQDSKLARIEMKSGKRKRSEKEPQQEAAGEEEEQQVEESEGELEAYTVFVEGIPYEFPEDELWNMFSECGTVVDMRLPRYHDSNRLRGYGHVDYETEAEMRKAIEKLNRRTLGSRYITVTKAKEKSGKASSQPRMSADQVPDSCTTLFVKNLPYDTDEDVVEESFSSYGKVVNVRLARWNHTGKLKGFGYVQFAQSKGVKSALANSGSIYVSNRQVSIDPDVKGRPKASFKDSSGRQWRKVAGKTLRQQAEQNKKTKSRPFNSKDNNKRRKTTKQ